MRKTQWPCQSEQRQLQHSHDNEPIKQRVHFQRSTCNHLTIISEYSIQLDVVFSFYLRLKYLRSIFTITKSRNHGWLTVDIGLAIVKLNKPICTVRYRMVWGAGYWAASCFNQFKEEYANDPIALKIYIIKIKLLGYSFSIISEV